MGPNLHLYWRLLMRRLPAMLALFLMATGVGVILSLRLPTVYQTEARLLVESAQIPDRMAATTVETTANEELQIIREQLLTRANLLDIANRFKVFPEDSGLGPDQILAEMRKATRITASNARVQPVLVDVSFRARTGQIAADVVNDYVTRIISANVELRQGQAEDTLDFFQQEVDRLAAELDRRSAAIAEFQRDHASALPENQTFRLTRQAQLQERLAALDRERAALQEQKTRLQAVFESTGQLVATPDQPVSADQRLLTDLKAQLSDALAIYSETNPRVVILKDRIAQLERQIAATAAGGTGTETGAGAPAPPPANAPAAIYEAQVAQIDAQVAAIDIELAAIDAELATLAAAIAESPLNAIALQALEREFANTQSEYNNAVKQLSEASTGERIELSARGQRITQIETATVPQSPASPNRPMVAAAGAAVGLGLAAGLFLLLELLNRSVRIPSEMIRGLGITPFAAVPFIESRRHLLARRGLQLTALLVVLGGIPAGLWAVDTYYLPLDLLAERLLDRIGLG
jgi:uncharacterized protein involved in exopolysaccharide biosynthesis